MQFDELSPDTAKASLSKLTLLAASQAVAPVAVCFAVALLSGHKTAGTVAASGAFTVGFAPFNAVSNSPAFTMLLTGLGIALAATVGSLCGLHASVLLAGTAAWVLATGLVVAASKNAAWVALQTAIYFVVAGYFSLGPAYALNRGLLVLAGALLATGMYIARWSFTPHPSVNSLKIHIQQSWTGGLDELRRAFHLRSPAIQHAIRLTLALLIATASYRYYAIQNGNWIPMTALLVLKPDWVDTRSRGIARVSGTLVGAGLASIVAYSFTSRSWILALLAITFAWCCYALQSVNYAAFSCAMTSYIVFLLAFGGFAEHRAIMLRAACTLAGGALGLAVDGLWPSAFQSTR